MHGLPTARSTTSAVLLLIVSLGAVGISIPSAEAQVPVFTIAGVVYNPDYQPLGGASITVLKPDGSTAGSAQSGSDGKYSVGSLVSGTYNVTVAHACCDKETIPVQVSGTDPTVQQNFRLHSPSGAPVTDARVLKGVAKGPDGKALAGVFVEAYGYSSQPYDGKDYIRPPGQTYASTTTGPDGAYSFSLPVGSANLNAYKDGYDRLHANFEMQDNRTLDLPMRKSEAQSVTVQGTVKSSQGGALANAYVNIGIDYSCGGGDGREMMCAMPVQDGGGTQEGDVWIYYEPAYGSYNSTQTDSNGRYMMRVAPGRYRISVWAEDHRQADAAVAGESGETKTVDFTLQRIPADSVRLHGTILDAKTGKPVPYASVNAENQQWGSYHGAMTKADGTFDFMVKPGYIIVTVRADEWYWTPCAQPEPMMTDDYGRSESSPETVASSHSASPETVGSSHPPSDESPSSPAPCDGGGQQRQQFYYPKVVTFTAAEKEDKPLDAKLQARPMPDATFIGYVVNSSNQKAVPNAQVSFFNEFTRDWGAATTDEHGSYKIRVHAGYYTVRVYAEHYYDSVVNAEIRSGQEQRLDLFLTPGEKVYGCCYGYGGYGGYAVMAEDGGYAKRSSAGPAMGGPGAPPMPMATAAASAASGDESQAAYKGEASGLGDYKPYSGPKGTSPTPVAIVLLAAMFALAVLRRRPT